LIGAIPVSGAQASPWTISGNDVFIGNTATGGLAIAGGGLVGIDFSLDIGSKATGTGTVTVDGSDNSGNASELGVGGNILVGNAGNGTLTISNGGLVQAASVTVSQAGGAGVINIGAADGDPAAAPGTLDTSTATLGANGALVFNHTSARYSFAPQITGAGQVIVDNGTTILAANNTYNGPTTVNGGTLAGGAANAFSVCLRREPPCIYR
ncbi:MAG: hypothetical protein LBQ09_06700, partial [Acidobacteriaceae bacterium]|nr:hypothetical protein [Acidobacteriaceae bacterium]